jgi:hypothetical protein
MASQVEIVISVLIVQEPSVSSELAAMYLADCFGSLKRRESAGRE